MGDEESHSESEFYYPKDEEQAKTEQKKGHIINNLLTSSVRSLQGNLRLRSGCIDTQGFGLRFPCNDLTGI